MPNGDRRTSESLTVFFILRLVSAPKKLPGSGHARTWPRATPGRRRSSKDVGVLPAVLRRGIPRVGHSTVANCNDETMYSEARVQVLEGGVFTTATGRPTIGRDPLLE